ncbi:MAG TPA: bifunctional diaminohydroxyphosphoribosylaminopyrimidine deaminase/5-amino-6-(5-phosphoribosylamino)uracil reductase RibD [Polyangiaceae bacterium]|jgi:diaminohydroxyphosphoribosylaminopyrimidine deaminase/5-amino-6-(5-phosphoribosylamino)uracil reductase|nr:bifunctional diaminohydroxyphosphoribosylaminopyrimidine deaminase/5-amino-6-(5-phosphoribosylamino)uracil reductase RibD [Polyangiaceae bacterium]
MTTLDHDAFMRLAIEEAERARGSTGDNPWVGGVIADAAGTILGRGHTRGPGEDHAEIGAFREADASGRDVTGATLYSTLEPCSFHGRTPACSRVIIERRIARVVIAMNDPNPKVDGEGVRILQRAGIEVVEHVCERAVRRQLGAWVFTYHPHEPARWARSLGDPPPADVIDRLVDRYDVDRVRAARAAPGSRA